MLLSEARKHFKVIGCKLKVKSHSYGRHVEIIRDGESLPSIFSDAAHRAKWLEVILLKQSVGQVFDDNTSDKIYGFNS